MKVPQLTHLLIDAYEAYKQIIEKKETIAKHLNPLMDKLLNESKICISNVHIGAERWQESTKRFITKQDDLIYEYEKCLTERLAA